MPVELRRGGLHLSGTALWLDAHRKAPLSFVSHAHSDHIARHERVIATKATLRLMSHRLGELPSCLPVPYNRPFELGPLCLELLPAGHILGSAQLRVIRGDGHRSPTAGDINLAASATAEPLQVAECDTLVLESTFGHPALPLPAQGGGAGRHRALRAAQTLERDATPVLLGYSLGKSQEVIRALTRSRALRSSPTPRCARSPRCTARSASRWARCGGSTAPGCPARWACFRPTSGSSGGSSGPGPGGRRCSPAGRSTGAPPAATARTRRFRSPTTPTSRALVSYARSTGAREVLTHHGFAEELATALRCAGHRGPSPGHSPAAGAVRLGGAR